jgi:hypothetical protein
LNGKITSIRFETPIEDVMISGHYLGSGEQGKLPVYSFGTIKGTVQTLSRRRGVRFTVYDAIFDRAISCYLKEGQEDEIKDYWGKTVLVSGLVGRDGETGKPFAIRDISQIRLVESSAPGSYKLARGILQLKEGETPESVIRAVRNG